MPAAKVNLKIEQRATFTKTLFYKDKFKKPIKLTGFTARMQARDSGGALLLELSTENGRLVIDPAAGKITMKLTPAETTALDFDTALYDLLLIAPGDIEDKRLMEGRITLSPGQTQ